MTSFSHSRSPFRARPERQTRDPAGGARGRPGADVARAANVLAALFPERQDQQRGLAAAAGVEAEVGEIAVARGWADESDVARAEAVSDGRRFVDLDAEPPDPALLRPDMIDDYIQLRAIPWRRFGGTVAVAAAAPRRLGDPLEAVDAGARVGVFVQATPSAIDRAIRRRFGREIARRAATLAPYGKSARAGAAPLQRAAFFAISVALTFGMIAAPAMALSVCVGALVALIAANSALRVAILFLAFRGGTASIGGGIGRAGGARQRAERRDAGHSEATAPQARPPRISLLIPLRREAAALPGLMDALAALDYPPERLEALLLIEADDQETRQALRHAPAPPFVSAVLVPPGEPRTKPRALNAALPFARGDIIGVYDAEDRPEPDQLRKVVETFHAAGPVAGCVQARLAYYNPDENWISRCFAIEYSVWFDLLLSGLRKLGLPIPLGGTSVFFRAHALRAVGAWDAHNVTEDADLGMRLARDGWSCELVDSTTYEEATCRPWAWIRQRSRWVKGYLQTWVALGRDPIAAMRELGLWRFLGAQVLLFGSVVAHLAQPVLWTAVAVEFATDQPVFGAPAPAALAWSVGVVFLAGQAALFGAAVLAVRRRGLYWLQPWCLTLPLYWPLGACAAYKAVWDFFVRPTHWEKTEHAVSGFARAARAHAFQPKDAAPRRR